MSTVQIVIGTHGSFGEALVKSAEMIVGKMTQVEVVSLLPEMSLEDYMAKASAALADKGDQIITLVDLFGGTPSNVFSALSRKFHNHVITGLNLPMLIDLYLKISNGDDEKNLLELVEGCLTTLNESGVYTNDVLNNRES